MHYYAKLVLNKRRSRNKNNELVLKKHFEHPSIDGKMVLEVFGDKILDWCKDEGILLLIMDNESKFHTQMLVKFMQKHGVQIYPGSGKKPWDRAEDGYPPRSHECMPEETEFAETHQEAQIDFERREKKQNQSKL